jgi:hypothetical protein
VEANYFWLSLPSRQNVLERSEQVRFVPNSLQNGDESHSLPRSSNPKKVGLIATSNTGMRLLFCAGQARHVQ